MRQQVSDFCLESRDARLSVVTDQGAVCCQTSRLTPLVERHLSSEVLGDCLSLLNGRLSGLLKEKIDALLGIFKSIVGQKLDAFFDYICGPFHES